MASLYEKPFYCWRVALVFLPVGLEVRSSSAMYLFLWCIDVDRGNQCVFCDHLYPSSIFVMYEEQDRHINMSLWSISRPLKIVRVWSSLGGYRSFSWISTIFVCDSSLVGVASAKSPTWYRRKIGRLSMWYIYRHGSWVVCLKFSDGPINMCPKYQSMY